MRTTTRQIRIVQSELERLPAGTNLFVFGSSLNGKTRDLDVLVLYDRAIVPPEDIFGVLQPVFTALSGFNGLPVHPTVLTLAENEAHDFRLKARARPIADFLGQNR